MVGSIIVAGVAIGVGFSNLKNNGSRIRNRIKKFWSRSGVGLWKSDSGHLWSFVPRIVLTKRKATT